ncbi:MAG: M3 family metallopeptidase, partial [Asticcacaulis sp.]
VWDSSLSSDAFQKVSAKLSPIRAAFGDEIQQNPLLFQRIETVYNNRAQFKLNPQQDRLLWKTYNGFVRNGAKLTEAQKKEVADINQRLATLFDNFSSNLKHDEAQAVFVTKDDLDGLPENFVASMAAKAKDLGRDGEYAIQNTRSAMEPFTTYSTRRDLREKVWTAYIMRGDNKDTWDNSAIGSEILKLRAKRAKLYGYPTHAHWRLEIAMAKTPENAMNLMEAVWGPAVNRVHEEVADMQAIADAEGAKITIAPWDYRFYAEKVKKAKYDLDESELKPYLQLDKMQAAMFWCAEKMYGFTFVQVTDVPVFHPDVTTYKVMRDGKQVGVWYYDPYAREGKSSGAWESEYQSQSHELNQICIVSNNCNFLKAEAGQSILISWDDAETMFHEFGHAIHALSSNVWYLSQAGTNTATDFVEFPSQLNEHWLPLPTVLNQFAVHYKTGEPMPAELQEKLMRSSKFNQGFATVEYLACALIDMKYHLAGEVDIDINAFADAELNKLNMPKEIVMRHRPTQFFHIFADDGYSAGYYSYLWSDALVADAYEKFMAEGGPFDGPTAKNYFDNILSVGDTIPQDVAYRNFLGRDVQRDALMRMRGFA